MPPRLPRHLRPPPSPSTSSTALGTAYEHHCLRFLSSPPLSLSGLLRVGGAGDKGVDLRGWWDLPASAIGSDGMIGMEQEWTRSRSRRRTPVVVQCKAESRALGPRVVRELEGVLGYEARPLSSSTIASAPSNGSRTVALLLSLSGFSAAATQHAAASRVPMGLIHLPFRYAVTGEVEEKEGMEERESSEAVSVSCNKALSELLGREFRVGVRREMGGRGKRAEIRWEGLS